MKESMDSAMTDVQSSVLNATTQLNQGIADLGQEASSSDNNNSFLPYWQPPQPEYKHPGKNWRLKRSAMPHWYKARQESVPRPYPGPRGWRVFGRPV